MSTPEIVLGASLLTLFIASTSAAASSPRASSSRSSIRTIIIAHIMFNISFVVVTVKARLQGFPRHLEEAAMDLGANEWMTFWKVTFPLILPGIMAAALLAFSLSIDDFVITSFTAGQTQTFPLFIYGSQLRGIPVQVNVIGTIIFVIAVGLVLLTTLWQRRVAARDYAASIDLTRRAPSTRRRTRMIDTDPPDHDRTPLPDHAVVPPVWGRITNLDVDRGEGSWLITRDGERYLDYSSGIGVTNTGHAHPRVAAAIAAQAAKLLHGQQNIVYHEPGLRLYERLQRPPAGRSVAGVPVELGRRGGRGGGQAGAGRDRPAGDHRVPLRLPRPDRPDDGAHDRQGRLPRPPSSRCPGPSTTRPTRTATGRPAAPTPRTPAPATGRPSST